MKFVRCLAALAVFALVLAVPSVASAHDPHTVGAGESYSTEVAMTKGNTLFVAYECNNTLSFSVIDPEGNVVKNLTGTSGGFFLDAQMDGKYRLVWESHVGVPTTLGFDAYTDVKGLADQFVLIIALALAAIVAVAIIVVLLIRRKK